MAPAVSATPAEERLQRDIPIPLLEMYLHYASERDLLPLPI
jgi:hypothetical protein